MLSADVQEWFGYAIPAFPGSPYAPAALGTLVFLYGGLVFIERFDDHRRRQCPAAARASTAPRTDRDRVSHGACVLGTDNERSDNP